MKKRLFACFLMGYSLSVFAIPNYWSATYAQGYMEYGISNDKHLSVIIACNVAAGDEFDNGVSLYQGENLIDTHNIAFVIDDEAYYIPEQTQTRSEGNMWNSFTLVSPMQMNLTSMSMINRLGNLPPTLKIG